MTSTLCFIPAKAAMESYKCDDESKGRNGFCFFARPVAGMKIGSGKFNYLFKKSERGNYFRKKSVKMHLCNYFFGFWSSDHTDRIHTRE